MLVEACAGHFCSGIQVSMEQMYKSRLWINVYIKKIDYLKQVAYKSAQSEKTQIWICMK